MPRQPDLIPRRDLQVTPAKDLTEPRLWVRRLVIWRDVRAEPIRDISLRPGLNIVWSPDGTELAAGGAALDGIGHGSGKTLFCRLLRYCLGESRFASEEQRHRIAEEFPEGAVGAEVVLNGTAWAVIRPFAPRRRHIAVADCTLEEAAARDDAQGGIDPFLDAVSTAIFPQDIAALVPGGKSPRDAWLIALAWLTRDQECRFNHVLDWRSTDSESESPARGLGRTDLLDALRVFLKALSPEERATRTEIADKEARRRAGEQERDHLAWQVAQSGPRLSAELAISPDAVLPGKMGVALLAQTAQAKLADAAKVKPEPAANDIANIRELRDSAQSELTQLLERHAAIEAKIPEIERLISRIKGEAPGLSFQQADAESPACPICEVPIDRVLAEGCGCSHKLPDLESVRQRRERLLQDLDAEQLNLKGLQAERSHFPAELALAQQRRDRHESRLRQLEATRDSREAAWYGARRLVDEVAAYDQLIERHEKAVSSVRTLEAEIEKAREGAAAFREKQGAVFQRLTEKFDAIIRELVGPQAKGSTSLTGKGLELSVNLGGDRSTAAIESLKIIAFDLAALALSIEGRAVTPEFLLHDSPREADLGLSLYHRLFQLSRRLEDFGPKPLFQYIVTTTTRPPKDFEGAPWLRLTLNGNPATERLLKCDL